MPSFALELPIRTGKSSMGFGGLMVHDHYRRVDEIIDECSLMKKFKQIAPPLGSKYYFEWLAKQGGPIQFKFRSPTRVKSSLNTSRDGPIKAKAKPSIFGARK